MVTRTTRKPRTARTKPSPISSLAKIISNNPKDFFTNMQNHKLPVRGFCVVRAVRVALQRRVQTHGWILAKLSLTRITRITLIERMRKDIVLNVANQDG